MPFVASLLLALQTSAAQPPASPTDSARAARRARRDSIHSVGGAVRESVRDAQEAQSDTAHHHSSRAPRHVALTPELERTAFADAEARTLLGRARVAHMAQDSALRAYDAKTYQRLSVGMGFRKIGRDRLLFRAENASKVHWDRDHGVTVEPTGHRAVFPAVKDADGDADIDDISPIPYFPGRETLWFPSSDFGVAKAEVDDRAFVHPLGIGAEAYYRYATGDSQQVKLPDGKVITLRELRITARRPDWHLFVGSFWFDVSRGQLVRAAYRMSVDMDIWKVVDEEMQGELKDALERAKTDTSAAARAAVHAAQGEMEDGPPGWVKGLFNPMRATISTITVEYGLHEGMFWLPRRNVAEGDAQAGFLHMPIQMEESFRYDRVAGDVPGRPMLATAVANTTRPAADSVSRREAAQRALALARTPLDSALARAPLDTSGSTTVTISMGGGPNGQHSRVVTIDGEPASLARSQAVDSTLRAILHRADSLQHRADSLLAAGDTSKARSARSMANSRLRRAATLARREQQCASDSSYDAGTRHQFDGALRVHVRMPCDTMKLANSPDLPKSPYDPGEELFSSADRDALVSALNLSLQPGWGPEPVKFHSGLDLTRYNRIEGLSVGGTATSALGLGYTAQGRLQLGVADLVPNAELSLARSNGRRTITLGAFHRLGVANDDWGSTLNFGTSVASFLAGRDEGFYYRTFGGELTGTRSAPLFGATVDWRLFAERQRSAGVKPNTQLSIAHAFGGADFVDNIDAQQATVAGASAELARSFGEDPAGFRLLARSRVEGAAVQGASLAHGDPTGYGRLMVEGTVSRGFRSFALALTGSGGAIAGQAPVQRQFYVGGLHTVRGESAYPTNAAGGLASGYQGDAFWLGRAELGTSSIAARPVVFFDAGWAGPRAQWNHPGRPLTGAGIGASFMDGLIRTDLSHGIYPEKKTRFDLYLEARF